VLMVPLLAGLYLKFPAARAAMIALVASPVVAVAVHYFTGGKGVGLMNPAAMGIVTGAVVMASFGVFHHAK